MKRKLGIFLALCIIMMSFVTVSAEDITAYVTYDAEKNSITLSGTLFGRATVMMISYEETLNSLSPENKPVFMKQIVCDGAYSSEIFLPSTVVSGKYKVIVTSSSGSAEDTFSYMNLENAAFALSKLEKAADAEEYKKIAEENAKDLGIDTEDEVYKKCSEEIYSLLYGFNENYTDPSLFNMTYGKMYAIAKITGSREDEVISTAEKFQIQLGIDFLKDFAEDERLCEDAKEKTALLLSDTDFEKEFENRNSTDFKAVFEEKKAVGAVATAPTWQDIKSAICEDFETLSFLIDNATYKKVKDKNEVFSKMMKYNEDFESIKDIEEAFDECVSSVYKSQKKETTSSGGGSSSGGGFSGGGATVTTPSVMEEKFPLQFKMDYIDFDENHWSYDAVYFLSEKGIISGYADNSFRADNLITRAEFVKLIISAESIFAIENEEAEKKIFKDVTEKDWFYSYVSKAANCGIVNGNGEFFLPTDNITREDAAVIIYRYISRKYQIKGNKVFSDRAAFSDYSKIPVAAMAASKIVSGMGENEFAPKGNLTRAQAAQLIYASYNFTNGRGTDK